MGSINPLKTSGPELDGAQAESNEDPTVKPLYRAAASTARWKQQKLLLDQQ
jgi:hypothetical protein